MTEICKKCRVAINPAFQKKVVLGPACVMHDFCYAQHLYELSVRANERRVVPCSTEPVSGVGKLSKMVRRLKKETI